MKVLDSGHIVGSTPELRRLSVAGHEIKTAFGEFTVKYSPRNAHDPKPWVSHGGDEHGFRYNARECYADRELKDESVECECGKPWPNADAMRHHGHGDMYCGEKPEPTLEEYAQAARAIQSLIPNGRNAARNQ